jgi:hypothetical protein
MKKRTTQKLYKSPLDGGQVLMINNLKPTTILSLKSKETNWLSVYPEGFSVSVMAKKTNGVFEVVELLEKDLTIVEMTHPHLAIEVRNAEGVVRNWLRTQGSN